MAGTPLAGSLWMLWLYDVCEEIDLDALRTILGVQARREPGLRHPSPEYVRFERPPVVQQLEPIVLESGSRLQGELNYYEYGVVSIKLELPFQADWPQLTDLSSRWMATPGAGSASAARRFDATWTRAHGGADQAARKLAQRRLLHHPPEGHRSPV